jgi:hypothetical protein
MDWRFDHESVQIGLIIHLDHVLNSVDLCGQFSRFDWSIIWYILHFYSLHQYYIVQLIGIVQYIQSLTIFISSFFFLILSHGWCCFVLSRLYLWYLIILISEDFDYTTILPRHEVIFILSFFYFFHISLPFSQIHSPHHDYHPHQIWLQPLTLTPL